jgi:hypothetical protein
MESVNWSEILDVLVPAVSGVAIVAVALGWGYVRKAVAASENKWDDKLVAAVEEGIAKAKADEKPE